MNLKFNHNAGDIKIMANWWLNASNAKEHEKEAKREKDTNSSMSSQRMAEIQHLKKTRTNFHSRDMYCPGNPYQTFGSEEEIMFFLENNKTLCRAHLSTPKTYGSYGCYEPFEVNKNEFFGKTLSLFVSCKTNIEFLEFDTCEVDDAFVTEHLVPFLSSCTSLKTLYISINRKITRQGLFTLLQNIPKNIRELGIQKISERNKIDNDKVVEFQQNNPFVGDKTSSCENVEKLIIDLSNIALAMFMPNLKSITVSHDQHVYLEKKRRNNYYKNFHNYNSAIRTLWSLRHLQHLRVSWPFYIPEETLLWVKPAINRACLRTLSKEQQEKNKNNKKADLVLELCCNCNTIIHHKTATPRKDEKKFMGMFKKFTGQVYFFPKHSEFVEKGKERFTAHEVFKQRKEENYRLVETIMERNPFLQVMDRSLLYFGPVQSLCVFFSVMANFEISERCKKRCKRATIYLFLSRAWA